MHIIHALVLSSLRPSRITALYRVWFLVVFALQWSEGQPQSIDSINSPPNSTPTPTLTLGTGSCNDTLSQCTPSLISTPTQTHSSDYAQHTVDTSGFDSSNNSKPSSPQSWLKENNRFVFVVVLGGIALILLIWYIVKSVQGMRKRLERENQNHMLLMQSATSGRADHRRVLPDPPTDIHTAHVDPHCTKSDITHLP
ncbi:hypothetical protein BDF14DRAFT_1857790 [Spinellus fusiger]|nr:hypothetical protein BDF14DRAFT_1857790 [Spinellus fusiger]